MPLRVSYIINAAALNQPTAATKTSLSSLSLSLSLSFSLPLHFPPISVLDFFHSFHLLSFSLSFPFQFLRFYSIIYTYIYIYIYFSSFSPIFVSLVAARSRLASGGRGEKKISVKVTRRSPIAAYVFSCECNCHAVANNFCFDG